ncbi:MAG: hypothetical protein ACLUOI_33575 [Eisenbergiella sp.]
MERYKVDRLKNGETMVNQYLQKEKIRRQDSIIGSNATGKAAIENYESRPGLKEIRTKQI